MIEERTVGRPGKYEEETKVISFRVPISAVKEIKETVNNYLIKLEK